jgi:hypothetical protein
MTATIRLLAALTMWTVALPGIAAAPDTVGAVSRLQNEAHAIAAGMGVRFLDEGDAILFADTVETGPAARAELGFIDDTSLTLGERASLTIDTFVFDRNSQRSLTTSVEGAFRFVSGQLSNGTDNTVTVQTPLAIISVRGTDFWGGPIDGAYGVFLIEGAVTVTTQGGEVTLDEPGTGTTITDAATPPGEVVVWPEEKVGRALAATSFQ